MKKRNAKKCVSIFVLLLAVTVVVIGGLVFAFSYERNKRPDDDISQAIYEAVGREKVHYYGKEYYNSGAIAVYQYTVYDYEDEKLLMDMVVAANTVIQEKASTEKINLVIWEEVSSGAYKILAELSNYYEYKDGYEQYKSLQSLDIVGSKFSHMECGRLYNKASTYINLPDIRNLVVSEKIAQSAEEEGIDWYEIWPELEYYEVFED